MNPQNPDRQFDPEPPLPQQPLPPQPYPQHAQPQPQQSVPPQPQEIRYIAVDANGVPLPNQPAQFQAPGVPVHPQVVHMARPIEPEAVEVSEAVQRKHEESKRKFPMLNLSEGEHIIVAVSRHPIGLISIWLVVGIVLIVIGIILAAFARYRSAISVTGLSELPSLGAISFLVAILAAITLLGGFIATIIYNGNKFFLTNESVIQEIQTSLFSRREQTVSLGNIEDVSYTQQGIIPTIFGYGALRLSTEGDETTYRFNFVAQPKKQVAILNNAVEAFKHGRPVTGD